MKEEGKQDEQWTLNCDAIATKVSTDPTGGSAYRMAFRIVPN